MNRVGDEKSRIIKGRANSLVPIAAFSLTSPVEASITAILSSYAGCYILYFRIGESKHGNMEI